MLTIWEKSSIQLKEYSLGIKADDETPVLGPIDLSTYRGRDELSDFFSNVSNKNVKCITADNHQFGNTSSGWKHRGDTRTIHIINANTVKDISNKIGIPLHPIRFRPNIVITNLEPWKEFEWVGKSISCNTGVELDVLSRTIRCDGVSVDPIDVSRPRLDIPKLLNEHFPQYGPYLGVYAVVKSGGVISIGDSFSEYVDKSCKVS